MLPLLGCFFSYSFPFLSFSFFFLSSHAFPARIQPERPTVIPDDHASTWNGFTRFLHTSKGSHVTGISELKQYFQRFGYLPISNTNYSDVFDDQFESAVTVYQTKLGLSVTGKLDSDTISTLMSPRCGVSDTHTNHSLHVPKRFAYFYGKPRWEQPDPLILTYGFSLDNWIDYLSMSDMRSVFERAFSRWASVIPVSFTETEYYESADIRIGFYIGDHGDGEPFDGRLGVLAHAFSPENGRLHLDGAETWAVDLSHLKSKAAIDLESVVTHEIGHLLGLAHSSVREAVMYPSLSPRTRKVDLKVDDVEGVQALYGMNPNFKISSLLESEYSSNNAFILRRRLENWIVDLVVIVLIILSLNM